METSASTKQTDHADAYTPGRDFNDSLNIISVADAKDGGRSHNRRAMTMRPMRGSEKENEAGGVIVDLEKNKEELYWIDLRAPFLRHLAADPTVEDRTLIPFDSKSLGRSRRTCTRVEMIDILKRIEEDDQPAR